MATIIDLPDNCTIEADDLDTLEGYADQLGVSVKQLVRHAINKGMTDLGTAVSGQTAGYLTTLDAAL